MIRFFLVLVFYIPAFVLSLVAGLVGGRRWRVTLSLRQHEEGEVLCSTNIEIVHKK
jgi:hypothetical protein